jgi:aminocarboxymuconate-semialdehyde decarboxylase
MGVSDPVERLALASLTSEQSDAIRGANAAGLLGLKL